MEVEMGPAVVEVDEEKDAEIIEELPDDLKTPLVRVLLVSVIGSVLEWYDFSCFGFLAKEIGKNFFKSQDPSIQIIKAFSLYAGAFFARPFGSLIFGAIGDRWGASVALLISIVGMALPTALMAVLPTYAKIGVAAPAILTVLRLLQGIMVGGELVGAVIWTCENTSKSKRGMFGGLVLGMALTGIFLGSAVVTALKHYYTKVQMVEWGWRVPFAIGILVCLVGFLVRTSKTARDARSTLHAARACHSPQQSSVRHIMHVFTHHGHEVFQGMACAALYHTGFYISCVWLATYLASLAPVPVAPDLAFAINSTGLALHIILLPIFGVCADIWGRARVMGIGCVLTAFIAPPAFLLLADGATGHRFLGASLLAAAVAVYGGGLFDWLIAHSSAVAQYTAVALSYNFAAAAFGGTAPLVATALCRTSFPTAPGWYISAVAVVSLVVIAISRRLLGDDGVEHKRRERMAKEVGVAKPALDLGASSSIARSVNSAIGSAATANHV